MTRRRILCILDYVPVGPIALGQAAMDDPEDLRDAAETEDGVETSVRLPIVRPPRRWPRYILPVAIVALLASSAVWASSKLTDLWLALWSAQVQAPVLPPANPSDVAAASPQVSQLLVKLEGEEGVRWPAAHELVAIGKPAVGALISALHHENATRRRTAAWCLGEIRDPAAGPALLHVLASPDEELSWKAAASLTRLEPPPLDELELLLKVGGVECRRCAAWALGQVKNPACCPALAVALSDTDENVRWKAAVSLKQIGPPALDCLIATARDSQSVEARRCAIWAIGCIGGEGAVQALGAALHDTDFEARAKGAAGLGKIGGEQAVALLRAAANDPDSTVRKEVAASLKTLGAAQD